MTNKQIHLYKVPSDIETALKTAKFSFVKLSDVNDIKPQSILICDINELKENDFYICKQLLKLETGIIAIINSNTSENIKKTALNYGIKAFLHHNAGYSEIASIFNLLFDNKDSYEFDSFIFPQSLLNKIPAPIFIKDLTGAFVSINDAFCKYMGRERKELIGKRTQNFTTNKKAQIYEEIDKIVIETGEEKQHEAKIIFSDNIIQSSIVNKSPLYDNSGKIVGIICVVTDITERKKKEKRLKKETLQAKESDKLKSSFLSNMSHEIRTPMNAIVGFSQLLTTPDLQDAKKKIYTDQININAEQLLKLIEDIIEVSKIEAGKIKINKSACYINHMLDEIYTSFQTHKARLGKNHIDLILNKEIEDENFYISTDHYRINQIITNLLGNAVKFTEKGFVEFGYTVKKQNKNKVLEFYVKDSGLGINQEKIGYVFDRFSKIPASKSKLYGGTGIGLSISKSLTELLGGNISVSSEENAGTIFYFTIPYETEKCENIPHSDKIKTGYIEQSFNWSDYTILIAEDEEMNYLYLQEVLNKTKANVIWTKNGSDALDEVVINKNISIILMDVKMPLMDGYEATKKIKKIRPEVPIIIQTAYAMKSEREKGFEAGCNEYLEKPVLKEQLLNVIDKYLS